MKITTEGQRLGQDNEEDLELKGMSHRVAQI